MKITKAIFEAKVKELKATLTFDDENRSVNIIVDSPANKVWFASDTHGLYASAFKGKGSLDYIRESVYEDMILGLIDCTDNACEFCFPVPDDEIGL